MPYELQLDSLAVLRRYMQGNFLSSITRFYSAFVAVIRGSCQVGDVALSLVPNKSAISCSWLKPNKSRRFLFLVLGACLAFNQTMLDL